jgi:cation transport regulator ChaC
MMSAVFAYGSLASRRSTEETIGAPVELVRPAKLAGWRRRWSAARDNRRAEKRFVGPDGELPSWCLGLNLERAPDAPAEEWPNGALIQLDDRQLERLDARELRYQRVEVSEFVRSDYAPSGPVYTYVARPEHHFPRPPADAVVIAAYLEAVETAFTELGPGALAEFRATTGPPPVRVVPATLVHDEIPPGNPRDW